MPGMPARVIAVSPGRRIVMVVAKVIAIVWIANVTVVGGR